MTQSGQDPPVAAAGTPPLRAGGDVGDNRSGAAGGGHVGGGHAAGRDLEPACAPRCGGRPGVGIGGERRTRGLADRPRQAGNRLPPGGAGCRGHDQPLLGRGRLPQRPAAVGRPAPGSNLAWRHCPAPFGRGRRKRTRATGTSPASDCTRRAGTGTERAASPRQSPTQPTPNPVSCSRSVRTVCASTSASRRIDGPLRVPMPGREQRQPAKSEQAERAQQQRQRVGTSKW
jgi:hypothetical protein